MDVYNVATSEVVLFVQPYSQKQIVFCDPVDCRETRSCKNVYSNAIAEDQDDCRDNCMIERFDQVLISESADHKERRVATSKTAIPWKTIKNVTGPTTDHPTLSASLILALSALSILLFTCNCSTGSTRLRRSWTKEHLTSLVWKRMSHYGGGLLQDYLHC